MTTVPAISAVSRYSDKELISFLLDHAHESGSSLAIWRLPGSESTHVILSERYRKIDRADFLEELEPGFMMAPFSRDKSRYFLPADRLFTFREGKLSDADDVAAETSTQWLAARLPARMKGSASTPAAASPMQTKDASRDEFLAFVGEAIGAIESGAFEKVVPSRTRTVKLPAGFDLANAFGKLCASYPEALISYVSIPGVGHWLGASPEVLVCVEDKRIFKTVALAGTQPYEDGVDIRSVAWTQKEIEEQALVERYVISCFKKIRLREYEEHGPKTVVAGNLIHLKSTFTVDMRATDFPQIGTVMLDLLHPTSAVCGMPLEEALTFLQDHEGYDRSFYAGYLGPVNVFNNIDLFVNLRCMQLSGDRAILYAGAGVTTGSVPMKEWEETEMKLNTLLNVIF